MAGAKRGCLFGLVLGSILKLFVGLLKAIVSVVAWAAVYLGLWVPFLYALAGLILYLTLGFNPFEWTTWGQLYFAGFIATVVVAVIITVRNLVLKPLKSVSDGYKNPLWKRNKEKEDAERGRTPDPAEQELPARRAREPEPEYVPSPRPRSRGYEEEAPLVYESELEKGSIVHEFSDRFEVYVMKDGRLVLDKVEMKNEEL